MAGQMSSSDDEVISGINVTPLVDVVLVLLVIFMMTAPLIYRNSIEVQLPKAKTGQESQTSTLQISVDSKGQIFWEGQKLSFEALEEKVKSIGSFPEDKVALISADQATSHGDVIKLMDLLRQYGLTHFALQVEPSSK